MRRIWAVAVLVSGECDANETRALQDDEVWVQTTTERPRVSCPCPDPRRKDEAPLKDADGYLMCYQRQCEKGFFRCCSDCQVASCANRVPMYISARGVPECIRCYPGEWCDCDVFNQCPMGAQGRMVSNPGGKRVMDCSSCVVGEEPDIFMRSCIPKYSDVCIVGQLKYCYAGCKIKTLPNEDAFFTTEYCDVWKCLMHCAAKQGPQCLKPFQEGCVRETDQIATGCDADCSAAYKISIAALGLLLFSRSAVS